MYSNNTKAAKNRWQHSKCPVCVAILRLPKPRRFPLGKWTVCRCGVQIERFPCGHAVLVEGIGLGRGNEQEHQCPPAGVSFYRLQWGDLYPEPVVAPAAQSGRSVPKLRENAALRAEPQRVERRRRVPG